MNPSTPPGACLKRSALTPRQLRLSLEETVSTGAAVEIVLGRAGPSAGSLAGIVGLPDSDCPARYWLAQNLAPPPRRRRGFHDLRHTGATLLLTKGVHLKIVAEMLGHSSVSITLDI